MRNLVLITLLLVSNAISAIGTCTIGGKVTCNGKGIERVVVTDGNNCVITGNDGCFSMPISEIPNLVYIFLLAMPFRQLEHVQ